MSIDKWSSFSDFVRVIFCEEEVVDCDESPDDPSGVYWLEFPPKSPAFCSARAGFAWL